MWRPLQKNSIAVCPKFDVSLIAVVPRVQKEEDQSAAGLLLRTFSAGPVSQTCLLRSKRRELLRAVVTLDDSTPQRRISELRVWSYEPFIVPASSSSGYLSGQYLEVLYIIRNSI